VAWSPKGKLLAFARANGTAQVWNTSQNKVILNDKGNSSLAWSPDGKWLASASADKTVQVWDANTGTLRFSPYTGHSDVVTSVAWSPNGLYLASAGADKKVQVWDARAFTTKPLVIPKPLATKPLVTYTGHRNDGKLT
jgi:WD40 repeat protein